jgi:hypothetical protein
MLTDADRAMLAFEARWNGRSLFARKAATQRDLGITIAEYYERLAVVVNLPEAEAAEPTLVRRVRRQLLERSTERARPTGAPRRHDQRR